MATISQELQDAINAEIKNNPEKYTGIREDNAECATMQVYLDNPEAFDRLNPIDMIMLTLIKNQ